MFFSLSSLFFFSMLDGGWMAPEGSLQRRPHKLIPRFYGWLFYYVFLLHFPSFLGRLGLGVEVFTVL
jgi:hypothetical protein